MYKFGDKKNLYSIENSHDSNKYHSTSLISLNFKNVHNSISNALVTSYLQGTIIAFFFLSTPISTWKHNS